MSIINDALKKVQKGMADTPEKKAATSPRPDKPIPSASYKLPGANPSGIFNQPRKMPFKLTSSSSAIPFPSGSPHPPASSPAAVTQNRPSKSLLLLVGMSAVFFFALILYLSLQIASTRSPGANLSSPLPSAVHKNPAENEIIIYGIMSSGEKNVALINNKIYETGDTILGMRIILIDEKKVQMRKDGRVHTFKVH